MTAALVPLGDVADFINGAAFSERDWSDDGLKIIRIQNLTDPAKPFNRTTRAVKDALRVRPGDLLVSWSATLGVFEWSGPEDAVLNQHIFRVLPDHQRVNKKYLRHVLIGAVNEMDRHVHGATMKHINRAEFLGTRIPLPPIEEQGRIAAVLDAADALRAKRRQALARLDTLTQAIFIDMFGGTKATVPLGSLLADAEVFTDGDWVESKDQDLTGDVRLTQLADVGVGRWLDRSSRFMTHATAIRLRCTFLEAGDVLIARMPEPIGRACIFPGDTRPAVTVVDVCVVRPNLKQLAPRWLVECLNSPSTRRQVEQLAAGTTRSRVSRGNLSKVQVPVAAIDAQTRFAERASRIDRQNSNFTASLEKFDALFASLQQRAFRGEL